MNAELAEALEKSIQHWVENSMAEEVNQVDTTPKACALCQYCSKVVAGTHRNMCWECPVYMKTNMPSCIGTPYEAANNAEDNWIIEPDNEDLMFAFRNAALDEVEFLKSLRE